MFESNLHVIHVIDYVMLHVIDYVTGRVTDIVMCM